MRGKRDHSAVCLLESEYMLNEQTAESEQQLFVDSSGGYPWVLATPR
jgi:hypothetical protein